MDDEIFSHVDKIQFKRAKQRIVCIKVMKFFEGLIELLRRWSDFQKAVPITQVGSVKATADKSLYSSMLDF